jgi:hypothetical protein
MNRVNNGGFGHGISGVIMQPGQFSAWNGKTGFAKGAGGNPIGDQLDPKSAQYGQLGSVVDGVAGGSIPDPTNGATHYYNPKMATPDWGDTLAKQNDVTIGNHRFVGSTDPAMDPSTIARSKMMGTNLNSVPAAATDPKQSIASMIGAGNYAGAAGAAVSNPLVKSGMDALSRGMGGGDDTKAPDMKFPTLQTNAGQIAQMAPQLMAQLIAQQQQRRQVPGLSLGGLGGGF